MRLLIIIPRLVSYIFLREVCLHLLASGWEVHLAVSPDEDMSDDGDAERDGMHIHPIAFPRGFNPLGHLRASRALDRLVRQLRPDVVHAHFSTSLFTTALARRADWPPTLGTFHGVSFPLVGGWKGRVLRVAESWSARRIGNIRVLTDDDRRAIAAAAPRARVATHSSAGIGVDLAQFDPARFTPADRAALRAELGFSETDLVAVFVGRFVAFKGFGQTVRAFLRLAKNEPELRLLLVGGADDLHATGLTPAEEEAWKSSPVIRDAGYQRGLAKFLAAADFMVFPSSREGIPVCAMEALAMGVPVITRDARGCRDVVRNGVDGLVLDPCTDEQLAAAIVRLAGDSTLRAKLSAKALAGRERLDRQHFVREQRAIYEALAAQRGLRPAENPLAPASTTGGKPSSAA